MKQADYKTLKQELNTVLESLQSDETDIDTALQGYEKGLLLIGQLEDYLKTAENKIISLKADKG